MSSAVFTSDEMNDFWDLMKSDYAKEQLSTSLREANERLRDINQKLIEKIKELEKSLNTEKEENRNNYKARMEFERRLNFAIEENIKLQNKIQVLQNTISNYLDSTS